MEKKIIAIIVAIVIVGAALAAGIALMVMNNVPSAPSEIRVGYITGDVHHLPFAIANNVTVGGTQSIYAKNGLNVTAKGYASGGVIMDTGFVNGEVDIAYVGSAPAISKHLNLGKLALNTSIIAQVNEEGSLLVADLATTNASDLVGKKVASPSKASIQYLILLKWLEDNGLNITGDPTPYAGSVTYKGSVNYTDVGAGSLKTYMQKPASDVDHIAAFICWEPFGSDAIAAGVGHLLASSHDVWPNHPCCVIVVSNVFAAEHPEVVRNFILAHKQAINWTNTAKATNATPNFMLLLNITMSFTAKNATVAGNALAEMKYSYEISASTIDMLEEFTQKMIDFNLIASSKLTSGGNNYTSVASFIASYVKTDYV
jgi:NitT/TauT family transport system substrate-binding protein